MKSENIENCARFSGQVRRYHCWPTTRTQSVGEHSWQIHRIYRELFGRPSAEVADYINIHDAPENITGDPPFRIKRRYPQLKRIYDEAEEEALQRLNIEMPDITPEECAKVKLCDLLEMWEFGAVEVAMGNRLAQPIVDATDDAIDRHLSLVMGTDNHRPELKVLVFTHMEKIFACLI